MRKIISFRGYDKASNHIIYRNIPKNVSIDESYEKKKQGPKSGRKIQWKLFQNQMRSIRCNTSRVFASDHCGVFPPGMGEQFDRQNYWLNQKK